jgi:osmotically-inducible protein OsmY
MRIAANVMLASALSIVPLVFGCQMLSGGVAVEIPTAETPRDEALSKTVRDRLLADKNADLTGVKVISNDGKVYLSGAVKSLNAREQAIKIAWEAPGVQSVVNSLEVQK